MDYYFVIQHSKLAERRIAIDSIKQMHMVKAARGVMYILQKVFHLKKELCLFSADSELGEYLLKEIMAGGNFGHYDARHEKFAAAGRLKRGLTTVKQSFRLLRWVPREVAWIPAWKVYHWGWRKWNGYL